MGRTPTTRKDRTAVGIPSLFPVLCHAVKQGLGAAGRVRILNYNPRLLLQHVSRPAIRITGNKGDDYPFSWLGGQEASYRADFNGIITASTLARRAVNFELIAKEIVLCTMSCYPKMCCSNS